MRHVTELEERVTHEDGVTRKHRAQRTHTEHSSGSGGRGGGGGGSGGRDRALQQRHASPPHMRNASADERELPPYRHPPPITASPSRGGGGGSGGRPARDDSPPYDRPPLPPQHGKKLQ